MAKEPGWNRWYREKISMESSQNGKPSGKIKYLKIDDYFISENEIQSKQSITQALWDGITSVPHTQSIHCVRAVSKYIIQVSQIISSSSEEFIICYLKKTRFQLFIRKLHRLFFKRAAKWAVN
jgi:aspartokinase